jgi:two-component system, OmpR family, response regulator
MLVLSRREQESIVFPKLGIRIQVARIKGKAVSIGVEAPEQVRILRGELHDKEAADCDSETSHASVRTPEREREHELRNRVNTLTIALHLIRKKVEKNSGLVDEALLNGAIDELALIEETLQDASKTPDLNEVEKKATLPLALLVDDNQNESSLLAGYLRQSGFRVATALDGRAALQFIEHSTKLPDIVLLDMNMPGLNGRLTIDAIRRNPKTSSLRVFAVSGDDQETSNVPVGVDGVNRWFQKPIRPDTLVDEMSRDIHTVSA